MSVAEGDRGWWVISGDSLMDMLRRVSCGEEPGVVYADELANCEEQGDCLCFCVGGRRVPPSNGPCPRHGDQTMWEME